MKSHNFTRKCGEEYEVVISRKPKVFRDHECYDLRVIAEYNPDAIRDYLRKFNKRNTKAYVKMRLLNDARKHLSSLGWRFWTKIKNGNDEWRYQSPTSSKTYYSMNTVCLAFANGDEINHLLVCDVNVNVNGRNNNNDVSQSRDLVVSKSKVRKIRFACSKNDDFDDDKLICGFGSKKRCGLDDDLDDDDEHWDDELLSGFIAKKRRDLGKRKVLGGNSGRVVRSSKRVREVGCSSSSSSVSKVPRTVLAWLIENNVVLPRSKILYYKDGDGGVEPFVVGRIVGDRIKCGCCTKMYSLSGFQHHASGSNICRPAENMFLEDGRSLVGCQVELMKKNAMRLTVVPVDQDAGVPPEKCNDYICSICQYGGNLMMCDHCPSSFHATCLNLENVPEGDWFCPSCCCGVCGDSKFDINKEQLTDDSLLCCHQCERKYHARCKLDQGMASLGEDWFCCKTCEMMHWGLRQLLGKPFLVGYDSLTWTLVKPMQYEAENSEGYDLAAMAENYSKLCVALEVMHECFEPVKDSQTKRDVVEDVLFCRESNLNRLNFKGFYTVLLERDDELIAVAILRIYGDKVAEIPLIGTRIQHRRLGMCRVLMNEIEKTLVNLGVQKLVLPAAPSILNTWTSSFGFTPITKSDRSGFLGYAFLDFQDTVMCQKLLGKKFPASRIQMSRTIEQSSNAIDHEENCSLSSVFQEDEHEGSYAVDQDKFNGYINSPDGPSSIMTTTVSTNQEKPISTLECMDRKKFERDKVYPKLKFRIRKTESEYPKFEVICS